MSLTEAQSVYGGIHEDGLNDLLRAFFSARPRYLNYGSPGYVPATTAGETQIPAIPFPGVPGGIDWSVQLELPRVDLHPQDAALPPELTLGPGQVSIQTRLRLCIACETFREKEDKKPRDDEKDPRRGKARGPCFDVEIYAVGHVERTFGPDGESVIIVVDALELVDIKPIEFESVIECLILQILRAVLADVRLPLETLRAGAFSLSLVRGPEIENDQLEVYGTV